MLEWSRVVNFTVQERKVVKYSGVTTEVSTRAMYEGVGWVFNNSPEHSP